MSYTQNVSCGSKMEKKRCNRRQTLKAALWEQQFLYLCNVTGCDIRADLSSLPNPVNESNTEHVCLPHHIFRLLKRTLLLHQLTHPEKHSKI